MAGRPRPAVAVRFWIGNFSRIPRDLSGWRLSRCFTKLEVLIRRGKKSRNRMGNGNMSVRVLFLASVSVGLVAEGGWAIAQDVARDNGSYTTELPPVEITPPKPGAKPSRPRPVQRAAARPSVSRLRVYPTTPISTPSTALAVDKVPSSINFVNSGQIARTYSLNISDALLTICAGHQRQRSVRQPVPARTCNFAASSPRRFPARRKAWRSIRTACASTRRSATPSTGI